MKSKKSVFNIVSMAGYDGGIGMVRWKSTYLQHGRGYVMSVYRDNLKWSPNKVDWVGLFHPITDIGKLDCLIDLNEGRARILNALRHTDMYITRARVSLMERMDRSEEFN